MAEKGGTMFTMPLKKAAKSALQSSGGKDGPLKGKDDNPFAKGKSGRKVQFAEDDDPNLNFTSKSGGKDGPMFSKVGSGRSGKGDKTSDGAKTSGLKMPEPLMLKVENDLPKNAKCLMACEAADMLKGIQEQLTFLSRDPSIKCPVSFDRGLQYAKRGRHYTNPKSVRQALETLIKFGVTEGEICMIADVCPDTAEEVFSLVPSLKAKKRVLSEPLEKVLADLAKLKKPASNLKI